MTQTESDPLIDADDYRQQLEYALGVPFVDDNEVTILHNGDEIFPAMLEAIENAQHRVDFVTYVYWTGEIARTFASTFAAAAARGVRVRILLDAFGCKRIDSDALQRLQESDIEMRWFRPLSTWRFWKVDKRTHRKILVCDEFVGFTGGVGIADEWTGNAEHAGQWRETHVHIEGPACDGLRAAFTDNWNEAGDWTWDRKLDRAPAPGKIPVQVIRSSSTVEWTEMAAVIRSLICLARHRLRMATAYFVPDPPLIRQLIEAVERGVDVEIMMPGEKTDSRLSRLAGFEAIETLLEAGVRFWRYDTAMLHAKLILLDDAVCCIGSPNLNRRSMGKDEECCAIFIAPSIVSSESDQFDRDLDGCAELSLDMLRRRSLLTRVQERFARMLIEQL